ncbi:TPA: hypothetical protein ACIU2B_004439, partial [Yersinia enterocolitica]
IKQYDTEVRLEAVMGTNHYGVHIHAMTTEDLHSKSGIAVELAWRDLRIEQLAGENAVMKQVIDSVTDLDNEPKYHSEGMGCGLEDRGITDRYDAMQHGWECAMDRVYGEVIPCAEELDFSATTQALNEIKAQGVEEFSSKMESITAIDSLGKTRKRIAHRFIALATKFAASLRGNN